MSELLHPGRRHDPLLTMDHTRVRLIPDDNVRVDDDGWTAIRTPFWLRFEPVDLVVRHRWIRIRYSSSLFDEPVRPLIRFVAADGVESVCAMNGPALGSSSWIGSVPPGTVSVFISPARRTGRFSFRIDGVEPISSFRLLLRAFFHDPGGAIWAVQARCAGFEAEARQALRYACGGIPLNRYDQWYAERARPHTLLDRDRPRSDWATGPVFRLAMALTGDNVSALESTVASCRRQTYPRWSLAAIVVDASSDLQAAYQRAMRDESRLSVVQTPDRADGPFAVTDWHAVLGQGDTLVTHALAAIAEHLAISDELSVVYTDEDAVAADGTLHSPRFKPDWSPLFEERVGYVGRFCGVRGDLLAAAGISARRLILDEAAATRGLFDRVDRRQVGHVRRPLYRRRIEPPRKEQFVNLKGHKQQAMPPGFDMLDAPLVTIVIPTRDRADLLSVCVEGLKTNTAYPNFQVVIVDNGSSQPDALALLRDLRRDPRFKVLERPGNFNFSRLSNVGASSVSSRVLAFLNNDVEIIESAWLTTMVGWALRPETGAVGARLLFPNRSIQHAGVVIGMGGMAGHVYLRRRLDADGYLGQLTSTREVTAVTAACMVIERAKFEAVGGFDADNLPVDLNDIDLCLRIAERGWVNLWVPDATLIHVQSATRGSGGDAFQKYSREKAYFVTRWSESIRDDRFFHPAIDLHDRQPALG